MSTAREEILGRIRSAVGGSPDRVEYGQIRRAYQRVGTLAREACLELLKDRLLDYDAEIFEVAGEAEIAGAVEEALRRAGERNVLVAESFPQAWLPGGVEVVVDAALATEQMDGLGTVLTTCESAVASTGTIVLVHEGAQGRRAITLLPDHHICVLARGQVVETVAEALAAVSAQRRAAMTTISGPSATSDIEMTRIRGVHGPRRLSVVLYG